MSKLVDLKGSRTELRLSSGQNVRFQLTRRAWVFAFVRILLAAPIFELRETLAGILELKAGNVAAAVEAFDKSAAALKQYRGRRLPAPPDMLCRFRSPLARTAPAARRGRSAQRSGGGTAGGSDASAATRWVGGEARTPRRRETAAAQAAFPARRGRSARRSGRGGSKSAKGRFEALFAAAAHCQA